MDEGPSQLSPQQPVRGRMPKNHWASLTTHGGTPEQVVVVAKTQKILGVPNHRKAEGLQCVLGCSKLPLKKTNPMLVDEVVNTSELSRRRITHE